MLGSHWTTPRFLNNSSLCNLVLTLEVWCRSFPFISSVNPWWLTYHRVSVALTTFGCIARWNGISDLDFVWATSCCFIILLFFKHTEGSRGLTYVLQILRLHHYMLLVCVRNKLHRLFNWLLLATDSTIGRSMRLSSSTSASHVSLILHIFTFY